MNSHQLPEGVLLDERYLIQGVLGEGGFGITYAGLNQRLGMQVAIKEFFWRGHVMRNAGDSEDISVIRPEEQADFDSLKEKFLKEARMIRDFNQEQGVVRILDYFEANHTAYLVMEYVDGMTFRKYMEQNGVFSPENLFRRMLPLMESLSHIHKSGVIHRDISPDNIMVLPDGSFKLLDFGAARNFRTAAGGKYTAIARENYAPGEQFDKNGEQGPWTDVYALCATMYEGVTGCPPDSAVQRMFLDELKKPSELGTAIEKSYEEILMKGLSLSAARRYADMEEMAEAVKAALPRPPKTETGKKPVFAAVLACAACVCLVLGILLYREYDKNHKFRNVVTESFQLTALEQMTADEFAQAQKLLQDQLENFAGQDNYILEIEGNHITVTLPLDTFGGQEIAPILEERFVNLIEDRPFLYEYEIQAVWEDPDTSLIPGDNQCRPEELSGLTVVQVYESVSQKQLTKGQLSNMYTDMKTRLDSLGIPYAFGLLYGNEDKIVLQTSVDHMGELVNVTLGKSGGFFYLQGRWNQDRVYINRNAYDETEQQVLSAVQNEDGSFSLVCRLSSEYDIENLAVATEEILADGGTTLYLSSTSLANGRYFAKTELTAPITDGQVTFSEFLFKNHDTISEDFEFALEYLCSCVNDTSLPADYSIQSRIFMEDGQPAFGVSGLDCYELNLRQTDESREMQQLAETMAADGFDVSYADYNTLWVSLNLPVSEELPEKGLEQVDLLTETYGLDDLWGTVYFTLCEEGETVMGRRARVVYSPSFSERKTSANFYFWGDDMEAYYESAQAAWEQIQLGENIIKEAGGIGEF